jgi:membrane-bound metal-dependent hydrolase YbcI (DUF457 family)
MKHISHKYGSACLASLVYIYLVFQHYSYGDRVFMVCGVISFSVAWFFSVLPDYIESRGMHRTWAHSIITLLLVLILLCILKYRVIDIATISINTYFEAFFDAFSLGVLIGWGSHLLLDSVSDNGIPALYPFSKKRFQPIKLCQYEPVFTDPVEEKIQYLFAIILLIAILIIVSKTAK